MSAKACVLPAARNGRTKGVLNKNKPLPLGALEKIIVSWLCAEGAMMGTLMQLAMAAMGLGGWMHGGFTPLVVMGGTPVCRGLGFRFVQGKEEPLPNPVGLDGYFEGFCPPYYKTMADAVDAAVKDMGESLDEWERRGMTLPHTITNKEFEKGVPGVSEDGVACVKDICTYIYETYGKFPAFNDTMHLLYFIQAHHLDLDFYDKYFKKGAYLQTPCRPFRRLAHGHQRQIPRNEPTATSSEISRTEKDRIQWRRCSSARRTSASMSRTERKIFLTSQAGKCRRISSLEEEAPPAATPRSCSMGTPWASCTSRARTLSRPCRSFA